jgi:predicted ATPase/class 3 adenylate cyclase
MAEEIGGWLQDLGLGKYVDAFVENEITLDELPALTEDDLKELGLPMGPRRRVLMAIDALKGSPRDTVVAADAGEVLSPEPATAAPVERRQLTVLFCDLVGSTELSARLDPEDLREVMRRYQDTVAGVVARFEGHVAKLLGDGVLAFFGWPRAYEDQAERAVRSGLAAVEAVTNLKTEGGQALEARVGIATGQVVIGDIVGETATEEDAVAGETPNLAARLQAVASPGQVVIGATTRLLIGETFELTELGAQSFKGFAEPVAAWRVVGESAAESRFEAAHPGALTRFVGREHELGLLRRAWQQSKSGVGQVVLITGEAGIGKSRLVDALCAELGDQGYTRITLGCSPYHTNSALFPQIVHLERVLRWQREDGADGKLAKLEEALHDFSLPLEEAIPLFASLLSLPLPEGRYPPITVTPKQQKQQTLDATVAWLLEEAERQPVLQVWEDLHWADPSSLELLALEIEQAPTAPILNVLTFRPEFAPPWPQRAHMMPLTLNRLERPEVEALIGQHTGGKALPEEVVEHIVDKTDGVPLYVEELTKAILEADFLREHDGGYRLTGPMSAITIPATLQDSLMARLDRLPNIREVAQLGAVLGREFVYEMVQAIASMEETTLQNGLDHLVAAELLYQRGRPPRAKYVFKHALVQDAAYQSLLKRTRRYYHRQVAELLENRFPEIVQTQHELVAYHYTEAGQAEQAVEHWYKAGQQALRRSANPEAIGHLRKELEVLMTLPKSAERDRTEFALQISLGPALMATKGYAAPEVGEAYDRARDLCEQVGETEELFTALWGLWLYRLVRAEHHTALELGERLDGLAERLSETSYLLEARLALGASYLFMGELQSSREHFEEGVQLYDPARHGTLAFSYGGFDPGVLGLAYLAWTLWLLGDVEQAVARADQAQALIRRLDNAYTRARSFYWDAIVRQFVGDWAAVRAQADKAIEIATEQGFALVQAVGTILLGWTQVHEGHGAEGARQIRQGVDACRATGAVFQLPHLMVPLAEAARALGRPEEGLDVLAEAMAMVENTGERYFEAELHRLQGELLLDRSPGDLAPAESAFQKALSVARAQNAKSLELRAATSLARLWQAQAKTNAARELLAPVYERFTEGFDTKDLKEAKSLLNDLS